MLHKVFLIALKIIILTSSLYSQSQNIVIKTDAYDLKETAVTINQTNPQRILAAWNRWGQYSINSQTKYKIKPDYSFSTNSGFSWTITGTLPSIDDPEDPNYNYDYGFDPSYVFDDMGNAYYTCVRNKWTESLGPIFLSKTTNSGNNWVNYQVSTLNIGQDKCYMTIDNTGGNYNGRIYIAWVDLRNSAQARLLFRYTT